MIFQRDTRSSISEKSSDGRLGAFRRSEAQIIVYDEKGGFVWPHGTYRISRNELALLPATSTQSNSPVDESASLVIPLGSRNLALTVPRSNPVPIPRYVTGMKVRTSSFTSWRAASR